MVLNATYNNISVISWRTVILVEEIGGPGDNHRSAASHWQTLSHNVVQIYFQPRQFNSTTHAVISSSSAPILPTPSATNQSSSTPCTPGPIRFSINRQSQSSPTNTPKSSYSKTKFMRERDSVFSSPGVKCLHYNKKKLTKIVTLMDMLIQGSDIKHVVSLNTLLQFYLMSYHVLLEIWQ
jgi:hypothetical protein